MSRGVLIAKGINDGVLSKSSKRERRHTARLSRPVPVADFNDAAGAQMVNGEGMVIGVISDFSEDGSVKLRCDFAVDTGWHHHSVSNAHLPPHAVVSNSSRIIMRRLRFALFAVVLAAVPFFTVWAGASEVLTGVAIAASGAIVGLALVALLGLGTMSAGVVLKSIGADRNVRAAIDLEKSLQATNPRMRVAVYFAGCVKAGIILGLLGLSAGFFWAAFGYYGHDDLMSVPFGVMGILVTLVGVMCLSLLGDAADALTKSILTRAVILVPRVAE